MQWLAALCVKRPVFATVLILSLIVVGAFSFTKLGVDRFPKVDFPTVLITTIQPGAAPGCTVVTVIVGKSIFGKRSTPSRVNENTPMTVSERIRTVAKTGRLTHSSASHCMRAPDEFGSREFGSWNACYEF